MKKKWITKERAVSFFIGFALAVILIGLVGYAHSEPFLVCDPQDNVVAYGIKWTPTHTWEEVLAEPDNRVKYDLQSLPPGNYPNAEIRAGRQYSLDGQPQEAYVWGPSRPFALEKPAIPDGVVGIALKKASEM